MTPAAEMRLLRRLSAPGVTLAPDGPDGWAAFPDGDRRRRPLLRIGDADMRALIAAGTVSGGPVRALTEAGRARLTRLRAGRSQDFAVQHRILAERAMPDGGGGPVTVNLAESPLARLTRSDSASGQASFDWAELTAGERLRADLARSTYNARVTMDWGAPPAGKGAARTGRDPGGAADATLAARTRVNAALDYVGAPLSSVLLDILWRELSLEAVERAQNWPRRTGRLGVKLALARLAQHYGLTSAPSVRA